jgi:uncharacterized LabA/DUF88 family protein
MSHNVGVFVDVSNLFYSAKSAGVEVNYCKLLEYAVAGRDLIRACAYTGVDPDNPNQRRFIDFLRANGYKVVCKDIHKYEGGRIKANLDIEMAVDIMLLSENLDVVVIVSGDGDFVRLVQAVQLKGVRCEVISFGISTSNELIEAADSFTEIGSLSGIFRNGPAGAGMQPGQHLKEGAAPGDVRGIYSYNAYSYSASFSLPSERLSGERIRTRPITATEISSPEGHATDNGGHSPGYGFATHDEPFMLPDADACGDPHSTPLIRPTPLNGKHSEAQGD